MPRNPSRRGKGDVWCARLRPCRQNANFPSGADGQRKKRKYFSNSPDLGEEKFGEMSFVGLMLPVFSIAESLRQAGNAACVACVRNLAMVLLSIAVPEATRIRRCS
jgi:hypothetical protein